MLQCRSLGLKGWSRARYLRLRTDSLYSVVGTNPSEPQGLTMRSGPHQSCRAVGVLSYDAKDVVGHWCQRSPLDMTTWCRITFDAVSGWILDGLLERQQ